MHVYALNVHQMAIVSMCKRSHKFTTCELRCLWALLVPYLLIGFSIFKRIINRHESHWFYFHFEMKILHFDLCSSQLLIFVGNLPTVDCFFTISAFHHFDCNWFGLNGLCWFWKKNWFESSDWHEHWKWLKMEQKW